MTDGLRHFLQAPRALQRKCKNIEMQLDTLRRSMEPQGIRYDKDRVQITPSDPMLAYIEHLEELQQKYCTTYRAFIKALSNFEAMVDRLEPDQCHIIMERWLNDTDYAVITEQLNLSDATVYRLGAEAVKAMEEYLPEFSAT